MNKGDNRKLCGLLGLAAKAGKVQSGEFSTEKSLKTKRAKLCLIAADASDATKKHISDMCAYRNVPVFTELMDKELLGHTVGKQMRASLTIEDAGFAGAVLKIIEGGNPAGGSLDALKNGQEGGNPAGGYQNALKSGQ